MYAHVAALLLLCAEPSVHLRRTSASPMCPGPWRIGSTSHQSLGCATSAGGHKQCQALCLMQSEPACAGSSAVMQSCCQIANVLQLAPCACVCNSHEADVLAPTHRTFTCLPVCRRAVVPFMQRMPALGLSILSTSLADLRHNPPTEWTSFLLEEFHRKRLGVPATQVAAVLWAASRLLRNRQQDGDEYAGPGRDWVQQYEPLLQVRLCSLYT